MFDDFGLGRRGTNTGTSASSITDAPNFEGPGAAEGMEVGTQVMITSGTRDGDIVQLASKPRQTTGLMEVRPDFGAALADGDTFEALYGRLRYDGDRGLHDMMNQALATIAWERRLIPVTLLPDGDMLASGTTDWDEDQNESPTVGKTAGTFLSQGLRLLSVSTSQQTVNPYTGSRLVGVEEDESYFFEITGFVNVAQHVAKVVLRDVTNGVDISLEEEDIDRSEPEILMNPSVVMPSGCEDVRVRIQVTPSVGSPTALLANAILRKNSAREFTIQDRPIHILRLGKLLATRVDQWSERGRRWTEVSAEAVQLDSGIWQYQTSENLSGLSVWYEEYLRPGSLDTDSDTTSVPKEHLAAVAAEMVLRPLRADKRWGAKWDSAARAAAVVRQAYSSLHTVRNEGRRVYSLPAV
jgi:hypothetical protein